MASFIVACTLFIPVVVSLQKSWHPANFRNQKMLWIAETEEEEQKKKSDAVSREFAQEQEFHRNTLLLSEKDRARVLEQQAVAFMYQRPPGYDPHAEAKPPPPPPKKSMDEMRNAGLGDPFAAGLVLKGSTAAQQHKRQRDMYGHAVPTEQEFPDLANAPKAESAKAVSAGPVHVKPFALEVRNVRCLRCGAFGHSSGDRECPMRDINPLDAARQRLEDPLTLMNRQQDAEQIQRWELKHAEGRSPIRGGATADDENQQFVVPEADEELGPGFTEDLVINDYGHFALSNKAQKRLLKALKSDKDRKQSKKKHRRKKRDVSSSSSSSESEEDKRSNSKHKRRKQQHGDTDNNADRAEKHRKTSKHKSGRH
eukprot:jgi/Chlat1/904/Chrsp107S01329